jgi:hypothetical protein
MFIALVAAYMGTLAAGVWQRIPAPSFIQPDVGFPAAVRTHRVPLGFSLFLWHHLGRCGRFGCLGQFTGYHHFGFIAAVGAVADVFELFFGHVVLLGVCIKR